jgi:hypothetical protein
VNLTYGLTSLFGDFALLAIFAAGFTIMFSPHTGKALLKNILLAIALFVIGSILLQSSLPVWP